MPNYVLDTKTRKRVTHPILYLLNVRSNVLMTPQVRRKLLERSILYTGIPTIGSFGRRSLAGR